ncbi:MAG TPA: DAK2 domain-containing protein, partial [Candidatus Limnocylindrales bacterium]
MSRHEWQGADLLEALRHATATLIANVDDVNALNVFPVPDGDTGSNMVATLNAALEEALAVPADERGVPRVASAFAFGALMGARGNSGVILSQLFRGMSAAVQGDTVVGGRQLASAFQSGRDAAYAAVATPVEGTILTAASDAATAAEKSARDGANLEQVLRAAVAAATDAVERTPSLLPLLAHAGVVDAGARGLELLLRGALDYTLGKELPTVVAGHDIALPDFDALEEEGFGYETVFVVTPPPGARLDVLEIRRRLGEMGESVLVGGDERAAKVHIHNEHPDEVIAYGLTLGSLTRIVVEN